MTALTEPFNSSIIFFAAPSCVEFITSLAPAFFAIANFLSSISTTIGLMLYAAFAIFRAKSPKPPALIITILF